jgi:hypothetical protein
MARKVGRLISRGPRTWLVRVSFCRDAGDTTNASSYLRPSRRSSDSSITREGTHTGSAPQPSNYSGVRQAWASSSKRGCYEVGSKYLFCRLWNAAIVPSWMNQPASNLTSSGQHALLTGSDCALCKRVA